MADATAGTYIAGCCVVVGATRHHGRIKVAFEIPLG